ncbi:DUF6290 family protein [Brachyspira hyodysenteriae]|nr:DUF6290 family protein [Brachyspira hyodysenteriae]MCZ9880140.1 DUF6290 family protein [Brachyspira hyodysenteriae]MCZ9899264.1 DUF6290 family protein [Brachyspira hyodysenteriae]
MRVSEEEQLLIKEKANQNNISVAEYIRQAVLDKILISFSLLFSKASKIISTSSSEGFSNCICPYLHSSIMSLSLSMLSITVLLRLL